jgi:hypothetical protein
LHPRASGPWFRKDLETQGIVGTYSGARGNENGFFERVDLHLRRLLQRPELTAASAGAPSDRSRRAGGASTPSGPPIVPVEYLAWLQSTKCASVDLFGLEPKHGSAAKLYSIYVPLRTAPGAEDLDKDGGSRGKKKKLLRDVGASERERELPTLLLDRLAKESLYMPGDEITDRRRRLRTVAGDAAARGGMLESGARYGRTDLSVGQQS